MIVMKFGGSSLGDAERIRSAAGIIVERVPRSPVVVLSALGSTTDQLIAAGERAAKGTVAPEPFREFHARVVGDLGCAQAEAQINGLLDGLQTVLERIRAAGDLGTSDRNELVSFGERLAVRIVAAHLDDVGQPAWPCDAWDLGIRTDSAYSSTVILDGTDECVRKALAGRVGGEAPLPVVTGFIARDDQGRITNLGRGGSDLTASLIGAALDAEQIQYWKDVDGILTADPRLVPDARPVATLSYSEAAELTYFGAKVLHPMAMKPAVAANIPVAIRNTGNPRHPGTTIQAEGSNDGGLLRAVACKRDVTFIDLRSLEMLRQFGFLARVFGIIADLKLSVDLVATSEVSVSLSLDEARDLEELERELSRVARVRILQDRAVISLVGDTRRSTEILARAFGALHGQGIPVQMVSQGSSRNNISFVVDDQLAESCVQRLHGTFF